MNIGVSFPQTEIGRDPAAIKDFIQTAEDLGFSHITFVDHVLGSSVAKGPPFAKMYTRDFMFHEAMTLMAFAAAVSTRIELATAILILPQRQAVLVAKQAAEIDVLSGGRFRLGVGLGWNEVEFDAMGMDFKNRGKRIEEQIEVMRRLWSERLVTFKGEHHAWEDAGINPEPVQRPIPVWIGATKPPAIRRAGRIADGWFMYPRQDPDAAAQESISIYRQAAAEAGRNPDDLGINATVFANQGPGPDEWLSVFEKWRQIGATDFTFRPAESGAPGVEGHLKSMRQLAEVR
jgi:probable F420-dependent oxidoreductase